MGRYVIEDDPQPKQKRYVIDDSADEKPNPFSLNTDKVKAVGQSLKDITGGLARSGMGVVSNLTRPFEALIPGGNDFDSGHKQRMDRVAGRFQNQGYDQDSLSFKGGKLAGDVAITAPIGGALGGLAAKVPMLTKAVPNLAPALSSGGFRVAQPATTTLGKVGNAALRTGAGGVVGGTMAGALNFDDAGTGAVLGAAMPGAAKVAGETGKFISDKVMVPAARKLMQAALKPTIKQLKTGEAKVAVDTLLKHGITPNAKGVEKLRVMVDDLNNASTDIINRSNATVSRPSVLNYLDDVRGKFSNQVSPTSDLGAIQGVADDFIAHPGILGDNIPVKQAQALKQGTYSTLSGKYGEAGSAATEAQKALARGLKDKIAEAVPEVAPINAELSQLIKTLNVSERRALMELNKNPFGLSWLAGNKAAAMAFMADRSLAFKAITSRMINSAASVPKAIGPMSSALENPALRGGLLAIEGNQ